jgi:1-acyl-sn-glycerol-3-phosphate acyltransferase
VVARPAERDRCALVADGSFRAGPNLLVINHLMARQRGRARVCPRRFVSKADVRHWPLLGWLIEAVGTLFIERERKRDALRVVHQMAHALAVGDTVAIFPEGTTGDGQTLLPFHANAAAASRHREPVIALRDRPGALQLAAEFQV